MIALPFTNKAAVNEGQSKQTLCPKVAHIPGAAQEWEQDIIHTGWTYANLGLKIKAINAWSNG